MKTFKLHLIRHGLTAGNLDGRYIGGESLLKQFEYMIRMYVPEAACVTHGGVIVSMLAQHALPSRRPEQWMADPGCGYTVQTDVQLWMRDKMVEAIDIVPFGYADTLRGQAETENNEAYQ